MEEKKKKPITLQSPIAEIKGIGEKSAALFEGKEIRNIADLLRFYPREYDFFTPVVRSDEAVLGQYCAVRLSVIGNGNTVRLQGKTMTFFQAGDAGGTVKLTYFNQPYIKKNLPPATCRIFRGVMKATSTGKRFIEQPQSYSEEEYAALTGTMQPRYSLGKGLKNSLVLRAVKNALAQLEETEEFLPDYALSDLSLMREGKAVHSIHFPKDREELIGARNRLVFDEFLLFQLAVGAQKGAAVRRKNARPLIPTADPERLIEALPYRLTNAQQNAWEEIRSDLCSEHVMNRLLQGDVGSGKTILAFLALLLVVSNGCQGALMAPTEVLAEQHMQDLVAMTEKYKLPISPVLLTGSIKGKQRKLIYEQIASGEANVIIGTHALIQDAVTYHDLQLVITDEQHRFGVRQRECFAGKGLDVPILVMSATPIPRTLAIILYGDLQVSVLKDMPRERLPIKNTVLDAGWREKVFKFAEKQIQEGHQVYIVCPALEEGELTGVQNVTDYTKIVKKRFPNLAVSMLHGKMKPQEKERIMNAFSDHQTDILVSTTVIEVGINVPNATLMVIENAERFGLAQLHQLRGRVGRGAAQSYCVFIYGENCPEKPKRLEILEKTNDGFEIAEQDLKTRGPGDLFGIRQSGELGFRLADIYSDADMLRLAASYADELNKKDPELLWEEHSKLKARIEDERANSVDFRTI